MNDCDAKFQGQSVEREKERFAINQTRVVGSLASFRTRGFRDQDFFFSPLRSPNEPGLTRWAPPLATRFQGTPRHKSSRRYPCACCTSSTGISFFPFFFFFSFFYITSIYRYYLDNFYVSYTLVSRNRVSLEPSRFSMMVEIVCMVYVEGGESFRGGEI